MLESRKLNKRKRELEQDESDGWSSSGEKIFNELLEKSTVKRGRKKQKQSEYNKLLTFDTDLPQKNRSRRGGYDNFARAIRLLARSPTKDNRISLKSRDLLKCLQIADDLDYVSESAQLSPPPSKRKVTHSKRKSYDDLESDDSLSDLFDHEPKVRNKKVRFHTEEDERELLEKLKKIREQKREVEVDNEYAPSKPALEIEDE